MNPLPSTGALPFDTLGPFDTARSARPVQHGPTGADPRQTLSLSCRRAGHSNSTAPPIWTRIRCPLAQPPAGPLRGGQPSEHALEGRNSALAVSRAAGSTAPSASPARTAVEHCAVLVVDGISVILVGVVQRPVDVRGVPEHPDQPGQPRHAGSLDQAEVEAAVGLSHRHHVTRRGRLLDVVQRRCQRRELIAGDPRYRDPDSLGLQQVSNAVDLPRSSSRARPRSSRGGDGR